MVLTSSSLLVTALSEGFRASEKTSLDGRLLLIRMRAPISGVSCFYTRVSPLLHYKPTFSTTRPPHGAPATGVGDVVFKQRTFLIFAFIILRIDSLSKGTIDLFLCPFVLHGVFYGANVLDSRKFDANSVEDGSIHLCASNFERPLRN